MDLGLKGKVAFVTGGSEGIGEGICLELAREGASVAVCARRAGPLEALGEKLKAFDAPYLTLQADVTSSAEIDSAVEAATAKLGPIDVLVNNAGGGATGTHFVEDPDEVWERCYAINLWPCIRVTRRVFAQMKERRSGNVVIISSVGGHTAGWPGVSDYSSAKGAQLLLTKNWALDFAPYGIRVNAVNPGFIRTPLWEALAKDFIPQRGNDIEEVFKSLTAELPARRMGTPAEVGRVVAFLGSDLAAGFITGACWDVDGGYTHKI
jgi:3-oxoacyl-[acyl-carrier protein] reductase